MTTNATPPAYSPAPRNDLRRLYAGPHKTDKLGEMLRAQVRDGRSVTREQQMRWQENREFFRGNQWIRVNPTQRSISALNRNISVPSGRPGYNTYNRLRAMVDARVSLMTKERPPYEVAPEDNDQDSIDAAKQAEKLLASRWGRTGWNIKARIAELAKNSDIDGPAFLSVVWDADAGEPHEEPIPIRADGQPFASRDEWEAAKAQDPTGQTLWTMTRASRPIGDVCWRVVLPAHMSVDPFAVKSFDDARWCCESRIRPRAEIEKRMGKSFKDMVRESNEALRESNADVQYEDLAIDDGGGGRAVMSEREGVVVHYFYAKPSPDWPKGLHAEFIDKAPAQPMLVEEWEDDLPYFCYNARPDPGHYMRSRSVTDDLKPIQRDYNQTLRDLRMWLNKVATAPVMVPIGSMRGQSFFNDDGYVEVHMAGGAPVQSTTPSEPTAVFTNNLQWMAQEMERISGVSALAQGFNSPGGPEASVGINMQIQQTEQNLSETEANLVDAIEWGCNRSLKLVRDNYTQVRTVSGVGVDDAEQFKAFSGAMVRGGRFRVTGPLMPKSKASRMAALGQFVPLLGPAILPYIGQFIDGDTDEYLRDIELDRQHQKGETRELIGLATNPTALEVYKNFEEDKARYAQAFNAAAQMASQMPGGMDPMTGQPVTPDQILGQRGITPPNLSRSLQEAGAEIPMVEEFHNHAMELKALDDFCKGDAYKALHPMGKQLLREHRQQHKEGMQSQMQAMAMQSPMGEQPGSAPAEKGTPSPPKQPAGQQPPGGGMG